jgi:hypothetical protein
MIFLIDTCVYAVMNNHAFIVLHVNIKHVQIWTDSDVIHRWHWLYKGTLLTQMLARGDVLSRSQ